MRNIRLYFGLLCFVLLSACDRADDITGNTYHTDVFKVSVIAPDHLLPYWERTAEWAQEILHRAQVGMESRVKVELEFHDENAPDIDAYIQSVATDEDYAAMIGPVSAQKVDLAARASRDQKKMLLLPVTTSAELQRIYTKLDHVFFLTQSDIIQMEAMFAILKGALVNNVGLITSNDMYGQTFYDWFGFLATERDFNAPFVCVLDDETTIEDAIEMHYDAFEEGVYINNLFFAPSKASDLIEAKNQIDRMKTYVEEDLQRFYLGPTLFCSDICVNEEVAKILQSGFEGVEPTANPASGFIPAYESKFGDHPRAGEAQLFDALYLVYYSLKSMLVDGRDLLEDCTDSYGNRRRQSPLWEYFVKIVDYDKYDTYGWFDYDVHYVLTCLEYGLPVGVTGASSNLEFDQKYHNSVTSTTYRHWRLHNGKFATLQYFSADGSDRTVSTINDWSLKVYNEQMLEEYVSNRTYPEHKDNYAVVVAGSSGWSNYRHQADALAMYHALKAQGFDDDHIMLIIEDDIADNPKNLHPGEMRIVSDGDNLYKDLMIDYKMSSLYPADIQNIMTGVKTARTPVVLDAGENDNVFVFWSGHGEYKSLIYNEQEFTASEVRSMLETMNANKKYRKLFFVMETCFSGSVAESCEGINGILMMTAANDSETSKADMFDNELGVYLSNGFTRAFQDMIIEQPNVILRDLFYHVVRQTAGSHASLYNYKNYGDIYSEYLGEMVCRKTE